MLRPASLDCSARALPPTAHTHERRTRWVVALTAAMMVLELVVGALTNSLALMADGWHMATHAGALGLSAFGYWFARTRAQDERFTFGTGKVASLAGYTSALSLVLVALAMLWSAASRLLHPEDIRFGEALPIAVLGLVVNLVCAGLLHHDDAHGHGHGDDDGHGHAHDDHAHAHDAHGHAAKPAGHGHGAVDHNLRAAYLHVLADALTSVLAIVALLAGRYLGWAALDAVSAIVGSVVILRWGVGLCRSSARHLLDAGARPAQLQAIRQRLEALDGTRVTDLHLWELSPGRRSVIVTLATSAPLPLPAYREAVRTVLPVEHLTVQVEHA